MEEKKKRAKGMKEPDKRETARGAEESYADVTAAVWLV